MPYFEVQQAVAERIALLSGCSISSALLRYTNLHRRFGLGRPRADAVHPGWRLFEKRLAELSTADDRLEWIVAYYQGSEPEREPSPQFGCFSFEPPDDERVIRIHFSNRDVEGGAGPLASWKVERRYAELRQMVGYISNRHPGALEIKGGSWLYNLDAYCRLFPPVYVNSRSAPNRVRLDGTSSWGQLLTHRYEVRTEVRQAVLHKLPSIDMDAPWRVFPFIALSTKAPFQVFEKHYLEL